MLKVTFHEALQPYKKEGQYLLHLKLGGFVAVVYTGEEHTNFPWAISHNNFSPRFHKKEVLAVYNLESYTL